MAFSLDDLSDVAALNKNRTLWAYISTDTIQTMAAPDYFNGGAKLLGANDMILAIGPDGVTPITVVSSNGTTVVVSPMQWRGTQAEYDALSSTSDSTLYVIAG